MADLVKSNDLEFLVQFTAFKENLPNYVSVLDVTPAKIAEVNNDLEWLAFVITRYGGVSGFVEDWTKLKNQLRKGGDGPTMPPFPAPPELANQPLTPAQPNIEGRFRQTVAQLKAHPNYTKSIGESLMIEAPETSFDEENYKPKGNAKAVLGEVTIKFTKAGVDGMAIYSRVFAGAGKAPAPLPMPGEPPAPPAPAETATFEKLAVDYHSPYIDNRPLQTPGQPETREYYLRGIIKDKEIGLPGDIMKVVIGS